MEPSETPPLVFAHQVIKQFVNNVVGEANIDTRGYRVIRLVFRKLGGSWYELCMGSPRDTDLLIQAVRAWGEAKSKSKS
jgi:hypothetical protein